MPEATEPDHDLSAPLLRPADLQRILGVAEQTLRDWRYKGIGPAAVRLGQRVYYRRSAVDAWIDAQLEQQHPDRDARIAQGRRP